MVMFLIMGLVILVSLIVIVGLFYFVQKDNGNSATSQIVPITDVSELKGLTTDAISSQDKTATASENSQETLEEVKSKLAKLEQGIVPAADSFEISSGERDPLEEDSLLSAESSRANEKIRELESQVAMISQKAIEQADEAVKAIEHLLTENARLKMSQTAVTGGFNDAQSTATLLELKDKNALLENQLDLSSSKVGQLETQLSVIKKELGHQLLEANSTIARLKVESESQERISRETLFKVNQELEELRTFNFHHNKEMEEGYFKAKEENLLLKDAKKLLEAKLAVIEDDYKNELSQAKDMVGNLANEKNVIAQQVSLLEQDVKKLKELNNTLIDKAKILQYELNRHRAQASGLERVCGNFKVQMEEMFQQMEIAKRDNNRLLQERINLEAGVVSLRTENSRLAERDKTYQQELEKTKEQITRFESIYNNFKTNVGDVSDNKPKD
jgi:hypothetical protein